MDVDGGAGYGGAGAADSGVKPLHLDLSKVRPRRPPTYIVEPILDDGAVRLSASDKWTTATRIAVFSSDGILVTQWRDNNTLGLWGGRLEEGDTTPWDGAVRELQEELGVLPFVIKKAVRTNNVHCFGSRRDQGMGVVLTHLPSRYMERIQLFWVRLALPFACIVRTAPRARDWMRDTRGVCGIDVGATDAGAPSKLGTSLAKALGSFWQSADDVLAMLCVENALNTHGLVPRVTFEPRGWLPHVAHHVEFTDIALNTTWRRGDGRPFLGGSPPPSATAPRPATCDATTSPPTPGRLGGNGDGAAQGPSSASAAASPSRKRTAHPSQLPEQRSRRR